MQKIFEFIAVAQLPVEAVQNFPLAAVDGGLMRSHCLGYFGFCAFFPEQLFDQPPLVSWQGADSTVQIVI